MYDLKLPVSSTISSRMQTLYCNKSVSIVPKRIIRVYPRGGRHLGRTLARLTQLKRKKEFDDFIKLVWYQGPVLHIAATYLRRTVS